MREWWRAHADELDPRRTFFINVDTVGQGGVRFLAAEGYLLLFRHDLRLIELSASIAAAPTDGSGRRQVPASPHVWRFGSDGAVPAMHGFPSITVCCTDEYDRLPDYHRHSDLPDRIDPNALKAAIDFVEELVRRIGSELVPHPDRSVAGGEASEVAEPT
jgi:hypothetical protein